MSKMCEKYLKWFSQRTIICSLRDLVRCMYAEAVEELEKRRKTIVEKRWEFLEKEERDKYEKIGNGVYQRKC